MAILNYTTKIDPARTVGEIQALLAAKGASDIGIQYVEGRPVAIEFGLLIDGYMRWFRLPSNPTGVLAAMKRDTKIPKSHCTVEQAQRVTWRIVLDWVEAQMAIIEAGQADIVQVFLSYLMVGEGKTLYTQFIESNRLLPGSNQSQG